MVTDAPPDLSALVSAIAVDKLRFVTADRQRAYTAILCTPPGHRWLLEIGGYYTEGTAA